MKNILSSKGSNKLISAFAAFLILSGVGYIVIPRLGESSIRRAGTINNKKILQNVGAVPGSLEELTLGTPTSLTLPRLGIQLNIQDGYYNKDRQEWTIDKINAFVMVGSKTPLIYGHNKDYIFGKLSGAATDELLVIKNKEGKDLLFKYTSDSILDPSESGVIDTYSDNTVYLMTCVGSFNEFRRLLTFTYIGESTNMKSPKVGVL